MNPASKTGMSLAQLLLSLALTSAPNLWGQNPPLDLPIPRGLDLAGSARHETLTLIPIVASYEGFPLPRFLTFAEGLASGTVEIREIEGEGGTQAQAPYDPQAVLEQSATPALDQASQRSGAEQVDSATQVQRAQPFEPGRSQVEQQRIQSLGSGDGARVNTLAIRNRSNLPLLVLAGDIVSGGKQNRVVRADLIVLPGEMFLELPVFCVEQGRWSVDPSTGKADFGASGAGMAEQSLRKAVIGSAEQREVWSTVDRLNEKRGSGQSDYAAGVLQEGLQKQVARSYSVLAEALAVKGVVGVVAYHSGSCVGLDLFASEALFAAYRERLAKAYILDALERDREGRLKAGIVVPEADARRRLVDLRSATRGQAVYSTESGIYIKIESAGLTGGALLFRGKGGSGDPSNAELFVHLGLVEAD
jgi:hypothetical protein